ncbi:hypothetical protein, partial [Paenibacillus typhae]|uniref:hypothetical protein n=1 Tax=Paenibacillus typhae TaxID=1174501 RepID=UPI001C8DFD9C
RRSLALLPALRRGSRGRERQLRAAALAWRGLAARYGTPPPGVTAREYAASLAIEDTRLRAAVRQFVCQWEALAYSATPPPVPASPDAQRPGSALSAPPPVPASPDAQRPGSALSAAPAYRSPVTRSAVLPDNGPACESLHAPDPSVPQDKEAADFISRCLVITFRLA